jgi:hypothetical protein
MFNIKERGAMCEAFGEQVAAMTDIGDSGNSTNVADVKIQVGAYWEKDYKGSKGDKPSLKRVIRSKATARIVRTTNREV